MLAVVCSSEVCEDTRPLTVFGEAHGHSYPHTCVWDCANYSSSDRTRKTRRRRRRRSGKTGDCSEHATSVRRQSLAVVEEEEDDGVSGRDVRRRRRGDGVVGGGDSAPHRTRDTGRSFSENFTDLPRDTGRSFFENFTDLPYEIKSHCLRYCEFHVIANPGLWFFAFDGEDDGPFPWSRVGRYYHLCHLQQQQHDDRFHHDHEKDVQTVDVSFTPRTVYVGSEGRPFASADPPGTTTWSPRRPSWTRRFQRQQCDGRLGGVNRYPCFYYRRCGHFDSREVRRDEPAYSTEAGAERWRRFHRWVDPPRPIDWDDKNVLLEAGRRVTSLAPVDEVHAPLTDSLPKLDSPLATTVDPGMYYWEFLNYNWEDAVAAVEGGEKSRQRHFFLDPSDTSHEVGAGTAEVRAHVYASLMLRRVVHPEEEVDDRFSTVLYPTTGARADGRRPPGRNVLYFHLAEDGGSYLGSGGGVGGAGVWKRQMVYQHVLTPSMGVCVFKMVDAKTRRYVTSYLVSYPDGVEPYSVDRNKCTLRVNFRSDVKRMKRRDAADFGACLVSQVNGKVDGGYAFVPSGTVSGTSYSQKLADVFKFFYDTTPPSSDTWR